MYIFLWFRLSKKYILYKKGEKDGVKAKVKIEWDSGYLKHAGF